MHNVNVAWVIADVGIDVKDVPYAKQSKLNGGKVWFSCVKKKSM